MAIVTSLPLIAMQFTDDVVWSLADFIALAVLLTVIGVAIELAVRRAEASAPRSASPHSGSPRPCSEGRTMRPDSC